MKKRILPVTLFIYLISCQQDPVEFPASNGQMPLISSSEIIDRIAQIETDPSIDNQFENTMPPMLTDEDFIPIPPLLPEEVIEETMPIFPTILAEFPGGEYALNKFIHDNLKYPRMATEMEIEGKVVIQFEVDIDGSVQKVKIQESAHSVLDMEARRVVLNMPKWRAAETEGKRVKSTHILPFNFSLQ